MNVSIVSTTMMFLLALAMTTPALAQSSKSNSNALINNSTNSHTKSTGNVAIGGKVKVTPPVVADATSPSLTGVWRHQGSQAEQSQRLNAINQAIKGFPRFAQGRARKHLSAKTAPATEISIRDGGSQVTMISQGKQVTFRLDGKPVTMTGEDGTGNVVAHRKTGNLTIAAQSGQGSQTTVYQLSKDGKSLTLNMEMRGKKLPQPLRYQVTFVRR